MARNQSCIYVVHAKWPHYSTGNDAFTAQAPWIQVVLTKQYFKPLQVRGAPGHTPVETKISHLLSNICLNYMNWYV